MTQWLICWQAFLWGFLRVVKRQFKKRGVCFSTIAVFLLFLPLVASTEKKGSKKTYYDFLWENWSKFWGNSDGHVPSLINFPDKARSRHIAIYGGTGAGKSRLLESMIINDVVRRVTSKSRRGVLVMDTHGPLVESLFDRIALLALRYPELYKLVYVIDPSNDDWSVKLNPLDLSRLRKGETPESRSQQLATELMYVFHDDPNTNVRQHRISSNLFWALSLAKRSLVYAQEFLVNREFREPLVESLNQPRLKQYWFDLFPTNDDRALELSESTLNRIDPLLTHPGIEFMLDGSSTFDFRDLMDRGAIILVKAPKGKLKDRAAYLLCCLVLALVMEAGLGRSDVLESERIPFAIYCDEFQTYTTVTMAQMVAEARKLGIELVAATQEIQGFSTDMEIRRLIRKVAGNTFCMRLDRQDAQIIVPDLFTPELVQEKTYVAGKPVFWSLPEIWEAEIRKITELPDRMLYWKRRGYPVSQRLETLTVKDINELPDYQCLDDARQALDHAAYALAGVRKLKRLPPPGRGSMPGFWGK